MKCDRSSENCCKEAKFKVDVYQVKRVDKGSFFRYERCGMLSKLFLCEDHIAPFYQDKLNYGISELQNETEKDELETMELLTSADAQRNLPRLKSFKQNQNKQKKSK